MCFSHFCFPPSATFSPLQANMASFKTFLSKAADMWGCCVCDSQSRLMRECMLNRQHIDRQHWLRHIIWICNRSLDVLLAYERQEPSQTGLQPRGCLPPLTSHFTFMTVQTRVIYAATTAREVYKRCYVYHMSINMSSLFYRDAQRTRCTDEFWCQIVFLRASWCQSEVDLWLLSFKMSSFHPICLKCCHNYSMNSWVTASTVLVYIIVTFDSQILISSSLSPSIFDILSPAARRSLLLFLYLLRKVTVLHLSPQFLRDLSFKPPRTPIRLLWAFPFVSPVSGTFSLLFSLFQFYCSSFACDSLTHLSSAQHEGDTMEE